jgi:hypothetical protein
MQLCNIPPLFFYFYETVHLKNNRATFMHGTNTTPNPAYVKYLLHTFLNDIEFFPEMFDNLYINLLSKLGSNAVLLDSEEIKETTPIRPSSYDVDVDCCWGTNNELTGNRCNML